MTTIESDFQKLNLNDQSAKGKQNMLPSKSNKMETDQPGVDTPDSCPSKPASVPDVLMPGHTLKGSMVQGVPTQQNELPKTDDQKCLEMETSEDSVDAVPSSKPRARVSAMPQANLPVPQQETGATAASGSGAVPRSEPQTQESQGAQEYAAQQAPDLEGEKDLILYELADQLAGSCGLRKLALPLRIRENEVAQIEFGSQGSVVTQFYKVFQLFSSRVPGSQLFKQLLEVLTRADQRSAASWLRNRIGQSEPEPLLHGSESSPISDAILQTETRQGNVNSEFYDVFLFHTGKSDGTEKFQRMCERHGWTLKSSDTIPAAAPVHAAIEKILNTSTHLVLIITESDCINYKKGEMCMTVEMALQLAYNDNNLLGRVLPIRCCNKRSLPLLLQALTGAHIDDESFENRMIATINTKTREARMREMQD
ncbi:uncharacterized protein LOC121418520 [Lytechinus variegatus]|uniref:uncharacterized protein LOC121418520 n=1 Tax=Lytechinus variegatus TaxID=7654 RepID=UPI001BB24756|nr:uncharacterized protein LOC121418520 [Lytechinus variegatus]